jgi:hypothetical protein
MRPVRAAWQLLCIAALPEVFMSTNKTIRPNRKLLVSREAVRRLDTVLDWSAGPVNAGTASNETNVAGCGQSAPPEPPPKPRP